jgi:hypothetical protein
MTSFDWIEEFLGGPDSLLEWDQGTAMESDEGPISRYPLMDSAEVVFTAWKPPIKVEKRVDRWCYDPIPRLTYSFLNAGPIFIRFPFILRFKPALEHGERWVVPTVNGLRSDPFEPKLQRRYLRPSESWFGVVHQGEAAPRNRNIEIYFPSGVVDAVEVKNAPDSEDLSISACIYYLGLNPGCEAQFQCLLHLDAIKHLSPYLTAELHAVYGPAPLERRQTAEAELAHLKTESQGTHYDRTNTTFTALREQAHRLTERRDERLQLIRSFGDGNLTVDDVIQGLG